jgi:hypothetical protein
MPSLKQWTMYAAKGGDASTRTERGGSTKSERGARYALGDIELQRLQAEGRAESLDEAAGN